MQEVFDKIVERLERQYDYNDKTKKEAYEEKDWEVFDIFTNRNEGIYAALAIVNQVAEEYVPDKNVGENEEFCEWRNNGIADEWNPSCEKGTYNVFGVAWFKRCPYCGKKIKVVE